MKAHISKKAEGKQVTGTHVIISDNKISGSIPYNRHGTEGRMGFSGSIAIELDVKARQLEIGMLRFSRLIYDLEGKTEEWHRLLWIDDDVRVLLNEADRLVEAIIEEHKDHLIDNHNDFVVTVYSSCEEVEFSNTGAMGYVCIPEDESLQDRFSKNETEANYYEVGFDSSFDIETENGGDKANITNIKITLDDYEYFAITDGKIEATTGRGLDLDAQTKASLERRIADSIKEKFEDNESYFVNALRGIAAL